MPCFVCGRSIPECVCRALPAEDKPVLLISDKLEPGPDFDERLAAALDLERGKPYSTDIAAAWLVVKAMEADYGVFNLHHTPADAWYPEGWCMSSWECEFEDGPLQEADTAPHAICLAALHNRYQIRKA